MAANAELVQLYWQIGRDIINRQTKHGQGVEVIDRLSRHLSAAFPNTKCFSSRNLSQMRAFTQAWPDEELVKQVAARLPWGHHVLLMTRLREPVERLRYAEHAIADGWSRKTLEANIRDKLLDRGSKAT